MGRIQIIPAKRIGEMNLVIMRSHYHNGVNGKLYIDGDLHCFSIELPWKNNIPQVSCIPEGTYLLAKRHSEHLGDHLQVMKVPGRELILIHPANNAKTELKGCIAPVTKITGEGRGTESRKAFNNVIEKVYAAMDKGEKVQLTIITPNALTASLKRIPTTINQQLITNN